MNKILKAGVSFALALIAGASATTLAACGDELTGPNQTPNTEATDDFNRGDVTKAPLFNNAYFIFDKTLHKGDSSLILRYNIIDDHWLDLDCGQGMGVHPLKYETYRSEPTSNLYESKCEKCFER